MSELLNKKKRYENFRRNLLANTSIFALLGYLGIVQDARAASTDDSPTLWVELGGQAEELSGQNIVLAPAFVKNLQAPGDDAIIDGQSPSPFSIGGEGKIIFTPHNTNWVFSARILYGRSNSARHEHKQTAYPRDVNRYFVNPYSRYLPLPSAIGDAQTTFNESHAVLDFQAGKDVGLGMFGFSGTSVISVGVRFAQFTANSDATLLGQPQAKVGAKFHGTRHYVTYYGHHSSAHYQFYPYTKAGYAANLRTKRNTRAFGPSISWDASLPIAGNNSDMSLTMDWGLGGAVLFGRQRTTTHHQTSGHKTVNFTKFIPRTGYYGRGHRVGGSYSAYVHGPYDSSRFRAVTIPNIGAFAGISLKFPNAQLSLGYRADFFFNATDKGIDARDMSALNFYGPFATISVGTGG